MNNSNQTHGQSLGKYLRNLREAKQLTLREVESITDVSNAYLSQLEHEKINKPSPNILHSLAKAYSVPYESLMEKAGYISNTDSAESKKVGKRIATFAQNELTQEEEEALLEYLAFLRSRKVSHAEKR